jgi:NAD+ kinase
MTLGQASARYLGGLGAGQRELAASEINRFVRRLGPERPVSRITKLEVERYQQYLADTAGEASNRVEELKAFLTDLKSKKLTETNLGAGLRVRRKGGSKQAHKEEAAVVELTREGLDQLRSELEHLETEVAPAVRELVEAAQRSDVELLFSHDELADDVDLCIVLGGDGTILTALRRYAGTGVPVFAVNYGEVGFLATIDPDGLALDFARAFAGEFDTIELPTISVGRPDGTWSALNDISVHRKPGLRVADLAYALAGEEIGRVRCDGLVISTPQGSTGYNLANGGPVLAWGVAGYVVSFIAPHTLTARALVAAPDDPLTVVNRSAEEPVDVTTDGRIVCGLDPQQEMPIRFQHDKVLLAQKPGSSYYHRLREKFGRLAY